ncbi:MAG: glycosyltransferase family 9 protein [Phycisphaerales bacterium]|nr:glycosyltransferase family 9 protein [Phycisphaerales bacterium]
MPEPRATPLRLLVVLPSWVGDAAMATPTLRAIRRAMPGVFIGGLCRPGIDELLAGADVLDEFHVARAVGVMGPKFAAGKVRPRRYEAALLLTNSFSTALTVRIAGIPRRIGYDRDARGLLLTDRLQPPRRSDGEWATVPAVDYYWALAAKFLLPAGTARGPLELGVTPEQAGRGADILAKGGVTGGYALLNPGGNNPAKRWPPDRFAAVADWLASERGLGTVVNGSPGEAGLAREVAAACRVAKPVLLPELGITVGALKAVVRGATLMVTNDTGPRHIAAAFGVPLVSLFGPTDHRWTIIPTRSGGPEEVVLADPTLPEHEVANGHPERCRIDRISVERVKEAVRRVLTPGS